MGCSERQKEIKRRRHRRQKITHLKQRLTKASPSEHSHILEKIRKLTPGAEIIIAGFEEK